MKVKDVPYELAIIICNRVLEKYDYEEDSCKNCPLYIPNSHICFRILSLFNKEYGNKEVSKDYGC